MVAAGVGVDILDMNNFKVAFFKFNELDLARIFSGQTVMKRGCGRKNSGFIIDYTDGAAMANKNLFKL